MREIPCKECALAQGSIFYRGHPITATVISDSATAEDTHVSWYLW